MPQLSWAALLLLTVACLPILRPVSSCGPLRGGNRRRTTRKLTPLVFKQHIPNVSEFTLGASGLPEGKLTREDPKFKTLLVPNYNSDIVFKDEEGTGADRLMTPRCKTALDTLAILVMNQYPGVKVRVTEGYDEDSYHSPESLHYEGRAVDVTTSDRDRSKYGMLARLAVEAGFEYVYYESRSHIHCSVRSETADPNKSGGCFSANSTVQTPTGAKKMSELLIGDKVQVVTPDGQLDYSEVILFLHRNDTENRLYITIETESGKRITLTPSHLIYTSTNNRTISVTDAYPTFAKKVEVGDFVYVTSNSGVYVEQVTNVTTSAKNGVFAPLTREGNVIVNDVVASCYAIIDDQSLAHMAFWPVRLIDNIWQAMRHLLQRIHILSYKESGTVPQNGVYWYAQFLYSITHFVFPKELVY